MAYKAKFTVVVDPTQFYPVIGTGRVTGATVTLSNPQANKITQNGNTITVFAPVDMVFEMAGATGFALAGIAFRDTNPLVGNKVKGAKGKRKGNGSGNMPKSKIVIKEDAAGNTTILASDDWINHAKPPNQPVWELFLMVQDSLGNVGMIDPDIENQD